MRTHTIHKQRPLLQLIQEPSKEPNPQTMKQALEYIEAYCKARALTNDPTADKGDLLELASIARDGMR